MARTLYAFLLLLLLDMGLMAQNIQLFADDFNAGQPSFTLNNDPQFPLTGPNQWVVNAEYNGFPLYANTISQDSIQGGGTINGAPGSRYLHIHDAGAFTSNGIANANFNPAVGSDNFAFMTRGICTKSIEDVKLSFFWMCEGNPNAYGEVYYSVNGGPWTKTGAARYSNQSKWRYEVVSNPAFDNVEELRFGFRWFNTANSGNPGASFSIDEVIVVGTYDQVNNPVSINVNTVIPDPVCRGSNLIVLASISDTLCAGTYRFWLSEPGGSFANATNLGILAINTVHSTVAVAISIPPNSPPDTCYKVRVDRIAPLPLVSGTVSICFEVINCPNVITTRQPVVLLDPDTICVGSVIDVPFNSTGVYNPNNVYTAELSDSTGSFANPFILGSIPDPNAYPAIPPGNVSGLVPINVPPGCGYYIRVVSNDPVAIGSLFGPFCIRDCDITTNQRLDISVCIDESTGATDTVEVDINTWNTIQQYQTGNNFEVEVRSSMTFGLINKGVIGAKLDTQSTSIVLTIPPLPQLLATGIVPGMYYIRVVADNGTQKWDMLGSLVRLTIGAPSEVPAQVIPLDSIFCTGEIGGFRFTPFNPQSQYEWQSPNMNNGQPFIWPGNQLLINLAGFAGTLRARVREINFGCYGPWSNYAEFLVVTPPDVNIRGGKVACLGDTVKYEVNFIAETYYGWGLNGGGTILDTTNNELTVVWDSIGTFLIDLRSLNECGLDFGFQEVTVYPYPDADLEDVAVCRGESVTLTAPDSLTKYFWLQGNSIINKTQVFTFTPDQSTSYILFVENEGKCSDRDTIYITVEDPMIAVDSVDLCRNRTDTLDAGIATDMTYLWDNGDTSRFLVIDQPGIYKVQLFDPAKVCVNERVFAVEEVGCGYVLEVPNAFTPNSDGLNDRFAPLGVDFELISFRVYNRWGELLYETNDPNASWDGTYKGEACEQGVYTWVVSFRDDLGQEQIDSGNVTLLR